MLGSELLYQLVGSEDSLVSSYRSEQKLSFAKDQFKLKGKDGIQAFEQIEWKQCDLLDVQEVAGLLEDVDLVYHCAALVSFDSSDDEELIRNNVKVTSNVVNISLDLGVKKLIHVSSVAALGRNSEGGLIDEGSSWTGKKNNSAYARSKYYSELELWRAYEEGLPMAIVNPSIIIGSGDWKTGSSALFGKIAGGFRFYSNGTNAYVDVRDVAHAMIVLMRSAILGERFVLMSENKSYKKIFELIADSIGVKAPDIAAKPWMGALVWRLEKLRSLITGSKPMVTPDTVRTSFQENFYSNEKAKETLGIDFRSIEESISHFSKLFLESAISRSGK